MHKYDGVTQCIRMERIDRRVTIRGFVFEFREVISHVLFVPPGQRKVGKSVNTDSHTPGVEERWV